jgi:hypothetical protein
VVDNEDHLEEHNAHAGGLNEASASLLCLLRRPQRVVSVTLCLCSYRTFSLIENSTAKSLQIMGPCCGLTAQTSRGVPY